MEMLLVLLLGALLATPKIVADVTFDKSYESRQEEYLRFAEGRQDGADEGFRGLFREIAFLDRGNNFNEANFQIEIDNFRDGRSSKFTAIAMVHLLYTANRNPGRLDPMQQGEIETALMNYRYWFDDPRDELSLGSSATENLQISFHAPEFLVGQLFPDTTFPGSGKTGAQHMQTSKALILQWCKDRMRFGYSEWLSDIYLHIDIVPLVALVEFSEDDEVRRHAAIALDLLNCDLAFNTYQGWLGSTRGRSSSIVPRMNLQEAAVSSAIRIMFGLGAYRGFGDTSGIALSLSTKYKVPKVLYEIARSNETFTNRQRNSLLIDEGPTYGINYDTLEDGVFWQGMGGMFHPKTLPLMVRLSYEYGLRVVINLREVIPDEFSWLVPSIPTFFPEALGGFVHSFFVGFERADIMTHRTKDYSLSSAQDNVFKSKIGGQQSAWQASFGRKANVFTNHPGGSTIENLPDSVQYLNNWEWIGGVSMPRVGQKDNVAIILYDAKINGLFFGFLNWIFPSIDYTHAYFPQSEFDEVVTGTHWNFGRKGDGYVALYSGNPTVWQTEGKYAGSELRAGGYKNAWICELGRKEDNGSFGEFVSSIQASDVEVSGTDVAYASPSQGSMTFGWTEDLVVSGTRQDLGPYKRYDNPAASVEWMAEEAKFEYNGESLVLDFVAVTRDS